MKPSVLWVTEYFPTSENDITGGVEARTWYLTKYLPQQLSLTIIASWRKGQPRSQTLGNTTVLRVGPHHPYTNQGWGTFSSRLRFALAALRVGKQLPKPTLVEGHNFISYLPAYYLARHFTVPVVATYHEVWIGKWTRTKGLLTGIIGSALERATLCQPWNQFIAVSAFTKKQLNHQGINPENITLIPNGVEPPHKRYTKFSHPTLCYLGRLTPQKRVRDLLRATALLKNKIPHLQLIIIGDGPERRNLEHLAKQLHLNATFLGFVHNREHATTILARSHLFVLPSILEGFGIALLEAAAAKTPYVASDIPALREISHYGQGGILTTPRRPAEFAHAIHTLLTDQQLYHQKQDEAVKLASRYQWGHLAGRLIALYQKTSIGLKTSHR